MVRKSSKIKSYKYICIECCFGKNKEARLCSAIFIIECAPKDKKKDQKCPWCKKSEDVVYKGVVKLPTHEPLKTFAIQKGLNANNAAWIKRRRKTGMEKEEAHRFLKDSIAASKERMDDPRGGDHYSKVSAHHETMVQTGKARKVSDEERAENQEILRNLNREAFEQAKIDPNKSNRQPI